MKRIDFEKSAYGQYVKLELETYDMFAAVSLINLYEDTTVKIVGTFSFDENGGYKDSNWEYSLDSGNTWKNGNGEVQKLTDEELTQLNRDDKIIVRFSGNETEYTINVDKMATPTITAYLNDLENRFEVINENILNLSIGKKYKGKAYSGEIGLPMTGSKIVLPCGIYGRYEF